MKGVVRSEGTVIYFRAETTDKSITWYGKDDDMNDASGQYKDELLRFKRAQIAVNDEGQRVMRLTCQA